MKLNFAPEKVNPEQRAAITAVDGPSLVIAGPGSGKTRTLTVKARYIRRLYPDARILCVTHTRKAADEMRSRIGRHENTSAIQVSTIHSLCYRILKTGLGQPIRILSDYDHGVIVRLAAKPRASMQIIERSPQLSARRSSVRSETSIRILPRITSRTTVSM